MIHIDINGYTPDPKWLKDSQQYADEMIQHASQKDLVSVYEVISGHEAHWGKLKRDLSKYSYGKCWFSEARELYSYYHIEHFRPKKKCIEIDNSELDGYWWLAFDWHNYRICGGVGNSHKGNHFAVKNHRARTPADPIDDEIIYLLDPLSKDDVGQVTFNENGEIKPSNPNANSWNYKRAKYTIEHLKLDFSVLEGERKRLWGEMSDIISDINKAALEYENEPSATKSAKLDQLKENARERIAPCVELSSTNRACLRACGQEWAKRLLEEQIDPQKYCKNYL